MFTALQLHPCFPFIHVQSFSFLFRFHFLSVIHCPHHSWIDVFNCIFVQIINSLLKLMISISQPPLSTFSPACPRHFPCLFFLHISSYFIHSKSSSGRPSLPWFPSSCSHLTKGIHHTSPYRQPLNLYIFGPFRELKYSIFSTSKWKPFSIGFF